MRPRKALLADQKKAGVRIQRDRKEEEDGQYLKPDVRFW
jgi:hypothetical protein